MTRASSLQEKIEIFAVLPGDDLGGEAIEAFNELRNLLEAGEVRAAEPQGEGSWVVNSWVKKGILLGFRLGKVRVLPEAGPLRFLDKDTYPPRRFRPEEDVRIVPGGTSVRSGAYLSPGVVVMPPAFVNVGAHIGRDAMIDSHTLVGSCAQIGAEVYLSAGAKIGGILEPVGALPVIIEDAVFVSANCGIYEGIVGRRAVLGAGVRLTSATTIYDIPRETTYHRSPGRPLRVPPGAVVVPGTRAASGKFAEAHGLGVSVPVIVKYRDEHTDAWSALEEALR